MAGKKKTTGRKVGRPKSGRTIIGPADRLEIERLYLQNWSQRDIADHFGVARSTIENQLHRHIRPRWRERAEKVRDEENAKVELLEKIAWERFEESKSPKHQSRVEWAVKNSTVKKETIEKEAVEAGADPQVVKKILTRARRTGEASWLQIVQWCIDWRARVRGDYATQKHEHVVKTGDIRVAGTTPEQFTLDTLSELLEAIEKAERKRQDGSDPGHPKKTDAGEA